MFLTNTLVRLLNPLVWRRGRAAQKFSSFALAEQASMVDMLEAARLTASAERAALYLRHAADESRHAKLFLSRSAELRKEQGHAPLASPTADTEGLFAALGEEFFLAFVHLGEAVALRQFRIYIDYFDAKGQSANHALLSGISTDECRHEEYTRSLLVALSGSEDAAKKAISRARRWRAWRAWRRIGRNLSGGLHGLLMFSLYIVCAPLALLLRLVSPPKGGWRQLK